jgi:hypothetical protein
VNCRDKREDALMPNPSDRKTAAKKNTAESSKPDRGKKNVRVHAKPVAKSTKGAATKSAINFGRAANSSATKPAAPKTGLPNSGKAPEVGVAPHLLAVAQKPGVLWASWAVEPSVRQQHPGLVLRLLKNDSLAAQPLYQIAVPADRGQWYFEVGDMLAKQGARLQLGYFGPRGEFFPVMTKELGRVPGPSEAGRTDREWFVSDERFREMVERAGGTKTGSAIGWSAAVSSRR